MNTYPITSGRILKGKNLEDVTEFDFLKSGLTLKGKNLEDAIESNFAQIAKLLHIGNPAGYRLIEVWFAFDKSKKAVVLHITACGSDTLVDYDPAEDEPKVHELVISASEDDCPVRIDAKLKKNEKPPFNPFDDSFIPDLGAAYGAMLGIIDEIGLKHCKIPMKDAVTSLMEVKHHGLSSSFPRQFAETCLSYLKMHKPKDDEETTRMMDRVFELLSRCERASEEDIITYIFFHPKTEWFFRTAGKITALQAIRIAKGLTQEQIADAAQMSVQQLRDYERCPGSTLFSASPRVSERLADALGVKKSEIVDENGCAVLVVK